MIKKNGPDRKTVLGLSAILALSFQPFGLLVHAEDGDLDFGSHSWSVVPSSTPEKHAQPARTSSGSNFSESGTQNRVPDTAYARPASPAAARPAAEAPGESKPLRLYGRIEELSAGAGAKIPLKLVAMVPVRDSSLDAKLNGRVNKSGQMHPMTGITDKSKPLDAEISKNKAPVLTARVEEEVSFPEAFRGTWSGPLTVKQVDFDSRYYEIDREEAEKQAKMIVPGLVGRCSVTFYQNGQKDIEMKPTQVVFHVKDSIGDQMKMMQNSQMGQLLGAMGMGANNPMLANVSGMQIDVPVAIPLGATGQDLISNTGVTGGQINNSLMKNTIKQLTKGVLEQQVVTRDVETGTNGQVKTGYTESVLRFTQQIGDTLYCQAASVSYDDHGNYLNKVLLAGTLSRGSGGAPNLNPGTAVIGGQQGGGGLGDMFGDGSMSSGGMTDLFGQGQQGAAPGAGGAGLGGIPGLGGLGGFGGAQGGQQGGAGGLGDGLMNQMQQIQQVQQMLKDMN